jgi:two-component system response regulator AtoC
MNPSKKLLLIEEESYAVARIKSILELFPQFQVTAVDDAKTAKTLLDTGEFEVVISDIYLSGVSGLELLYKALKARPGAAVIIIAGAKDEQLAAKALKEGAMDYVLKPPGLERLSSLLKLIELTRK